MRFTLALRFSHSPRRRQLAFTRVELLACIVCAGILAAIALPAFASGTSRSQVAQCLNNLRQMGRATQVWAADHTDQLPWWTPTSDGGEFIVQGGSGIGGSRPGNVWIEYYFMRNQLVDPRILACPADDGVKVASEFSTDASRGGFASVDLRNLATSYFLNLHTVVKRNFVLSDNPLAVLFGDRNVRFSNGSSCTTGVSPTFQAVPFDTSVAWTNAVHGTDGNIVRVDGSVMTTTSAELRNSLYRSDINGSVHVLRAR